MKVLCMCMHLLIILLLRLLIVKVMHFLGLLQEVQVLRGLVKVHHLQLRWRQKVLVRLPKNMALKT